MLLYVNIFVADFLTSNISQRVAEMKASKDAKIYRCFLSSAHICVNLLKNSFARCKNSNLRVVSQSHYLF